MTALLALAATPAAAPGLARPVPGRLERLKSAPRKSGEASFFFFDAHFRNEAVKVLPGEF
jgi:chemotaxis protein CheD